MSGRPGSLVLLTVLFACTFAASAAFAQAGKVVFAVGDVRSGNIKRVASAVGEGSIAVAFVHQVLQN